MNQTARFLYQFYKWLIFIPFIGVTTLIFASAAIVLSLFSKRFAGKWCGMIWARLNIYATPALITMRGRPHLDRRRAYVIVANHQSLFDIFRCLRLARDGFKMDHEKRTKENSHVRACL